MDILMVAPEYPPRHIGGGGVVYQSLSKSLHSNGHNIKVMAGSFSNKELFGRVEEYIDDDVPVSFLPLLPSPKFRKFDLATYTFPAVSGISFVIKELLTKRKAVIHLQGLCHPLIDFTAFLCIFSRKKYVFTCHGIPKSLERSKFPLNLFFRLYLSTIERIVVRKASSATFISHALLRECCSRNLQNKRMIVIPNGSNVHFSGVDSQLTELIEEKYNLNGKAVIFALGRLNASKGFQHLIIAMEKVISELPNAVLLIAGAGPFKKSLQDLIEQNELSGNVRLVGRVSEEIKAALYARSDVVVFPSLEEPFGLVILEALAMKKPVVAFNTDSSVEIIENEVDGLLVPLASEDKLAEAIIHVLTDRVLREKLIQNGIGKAANFSWTDITQKYTKIYCEA